MAPHVWLSNDSANSSQPREPLKDGSNIANAIVIDDDEGGDSQLSNKSIRAQIPISDIENTRLSASVYDLTASSATPSIGPGFRNIVRPEPASVASNSSQVSNDGLPDTAPHSVISGPEKSTSQQSCEAVPSQGLRPTIPSVSQSQSSIQNKSGAPYWSYDSSAQRQPRRSVEVEAEIFCNGGKIVHCPGSNDFPPHNAQYGVKVIDGVTKYGCFPGISDVGCGFTVLSDDYRDMVVKEYLRSRTELELENSVVQPVVESNIDRRDEDNGQSGSGGSSSQPAPSPKFTTSVQVEEQGSDGGISLDTRQPSADISEIASSISRQIHDSPAVDSVINHTVFDSSKKSNSSNHEDRIDPARDDVLAVEVIPVVEASVNVAGPVKATHQPHTHTSSFSSTSSFNLQTANTRITTDSVPITKHLLVLPTASPTSSIMSSHEKTDSHVPSKSNGNSSSSRQQAPKTNTRLGLTSGQTLVVTGTPSPSASSVVITKPQSGVCVVCKEKNSRLPGDEPVSCAHCKKIWHRGCNTVLYEITDLTGWICQSCKRSKQKHHKSKTSKNAHVPASSTSNIRTSRPSGSENPAPSGSIAEPSNKRKRNEVAPNKASSGSLAEPNKRKKDEKAQRGNGASGADSYVVPQSPEYQPPTFNGGEKRGSAWIGVKKDIEKDIREKYQGNGFMPVARGYRKRHVSPTAEPEQLPKRVKRTSPPLGREEEQAAPSPPPSTASLAPPKAMPSRKSFLQFAQKMGKVGATLRPPRNEPSKELEEARREKEEAVRRLEEARETIEGLSAVAKGLEREREVDLRKIAGLELKLTESELQFQQACNDNLWIKGELRAQEELGIRINELETLKSELQTQNASMGNEVRELKAKSYRAEHQLASTKKELQTAELCAQTEEFHRERWVDVAKGLEKKVKELEEGGCKVQAKRIEELQSKLAHAEELNRAFTKQIKTVAEKSVKNAKEVKELQEREKKFAKEKKDLEKELLSTEGDKAILEIRWASLHRQLMNAIMEQTDTKVDLSKIKGKLEAAEAELAAIKSAPQIGSEQYEKEIDDVEMSDGAETERPATEREHLTIITDGLNLDDPIFDGLRKDYEQLQEKRVDLAKETEALHQRYIELKNCLPLSGLAPQPESEREDEQEQESELPVVTANVEDFETRFGVSNPMLPGPGTHFDAVGELPKGYKIKTSEKNVPYRGWDWRHPRKLHIHRQLDRQLPRIEGEVTVTEPDGKVCKVDDDSSDQKGGQRRVRGTMSFQEFTGLDEDKFVPVVPGQSQLVAFKKAEVNGRTGRINRNAVIYKTGRNVPGELRG